MFVSPKIAQQVDKLWPRAGRPQFSRPIALLSAMKEKPKDVDPCHCVLILESFTKESAISQAYSEGFFHFIPLDHPHFADLLVQTCTLIDNPTAFMESPTTYLLHNAPAIGPALFNFQPLPWTSQKVQSSAEKSQIINNFSDELKKQNATRIVHESAINILDEMLMNALYDAPRAAQKVQSSPTEFFYVSDCRHIFIGCVDYYGSLDIRKLLARIHTVVNTGMGQAMNMGHGGAGIGLTLVIEQGLDVLAICERGKRTLFLVSLPLGYSRKKMSLLSKSLRFLEF